MFPIPRPRHFRAPLSHFRPQGRSTLVFYVLPAAHRVAELAPCHFRSPFLAFLRLVLFLENALPFFILGDTFVRLFDTRANISVRVPSGPRGKKRRPTLAVLHAFRRLGHPRPLAR